MKRAHSMSLFRSRACKIGDIQEQGVELQHLTNPYFAIFTIFDICGLL